MVTAFLQDAAVEVHRRLLFLAPLPAWLLVLVVLPALFLFVRWSYRGETGLSPSRRRTLSALRLIGLLLLLLALLRPAAEWTKSQRIRSQVHFLLDDSASMSRHEAYGETRGAALRRALGPRAPNDLAAVPRSEYVARFLGRNPAPAGARLLAALRRRFDLRFFAFASRPSPIAGPDDLEARGAETRIGDSLDLHLGRAQAEGDRLEAVVLVTDGRNNAGLAPLEAAKRYRAAEIPIHVLGVGDPGGDRNLTLAGPPGPKEVLVGEEAEFKVRITAKGLGGRDGKLRLRGARFEAGGSPPKGGEELAETSFTVPERDRPLDLVLRHRFREPGDYLLTFEVPPLPGESDPKDNVTRRYLRVDPNRILVLYLEDRPRWEYRYLERALKRVDESIRFQAYLFEGSPYAQQSSPGLPPLRGLPRTRKDLFRYHVILLGDVDPRHLGETEEERAAWLELLRAFVEHGGGLGVIAGSRFMPAGYRGTVLEDLLPVVLGPVGDDENLAGAGTKAFFPVLEDPEVPHPIVRLADNPLENRRIWERRLPPLYWYFPVLRPKAGATVLLRHPEDHNRYGRRVLAAVAPYPRGKVFFTALDSTWRWRKLYGEKYQDRFWRNVVRTLAETRLRRRDDRVELSLDRERAPLGARVRLTLRLLDRDYAPVVRSEAIVHVRRPGGRLETLSLPAVPGRPGVYEGVHRAAPGGIHSFLYYENADPTTPPKARRDLEVFLPRREMEEPSLDEDGLRRLAAAAGGTYRPLHEVAGLLEPLMEAGGGVRILERRTEELWDRVWTFIVVLSVFTVEWVLRKRWRLV